MFSQLSSYIYSILIGFIFTTTSASALSCAYYERTCYESTTYSYNYWCCSNDDICGTYYGTQCISHNSGLPASIIALIISAAIFVCATCCFCWARAQRRQRLRYPVNYGNTPTILHGYQQQPIVGAARVAPSGYPYAATVAPPIHNVYEAPPPSYGAVIGNAPPKYTSEPSAPPPSVTATAVPAYPRV